MRQKLVAVFLTAFITLAPPVLLATPMNNEYLVRLVKAGWTEPLVLSTIDGSEPQFDTRADGLIKLKQSSVSDAVIQRVLARKAAAAFCSGSVVATAAQTHHQQANGAYFQPVDVQHLPNPTQLRLWACKVLARTKNDVCCPSVNTCPKTV